MTEKLFTRTLNKNQNKIKQKKILDLEKALDRVFRKVLWWALGSERTCHSGHVYGSGFPRKFNIKFHDYSMIVP